MRAPLRPVVVDAAGSSATVASVFTLAGAAQAERVLGAASGLLADRLDGAAVDEVLRAHQ